MQQFEIGTKFSSGGKHPRICTVVDFYVTKNLNGEIVSEQYVATHEFLGQTIKHIVPTSSIARRLIK